MVLELASLLSRSVPFRKQCVWRLHYRATLPSSLRILRFITKDWHTSETIDGYTRHQSVSPPISATLQADDDPPNFTIMLAGLALSFSTGILLQLLGCILWKNWWPMLTAFMYVLVPMPYLFFGAAEAGGSSAIYGGSSLASGWIDAGKFLTGFSAVGSIAIPAILFHSEKITSGALGLELGAVAVLGGTILAYDYYSSRDSSYY